MIQLQQKASTKSYFLFQNINFCSIIISFIMILHLQVLGIAVADEIISVGGIVDENTRAGKEIKAAMVLAARKLNSSSDNDKISLHFGNSSEETPLQTALIASELVKDKNVQIIMGMDTWEKTAIVADAVNQAKLPIVSFAPTITTRPLNSNQWPFLIQMGTNFTSQTNCIAAMVRSYNWKRVIPIYEADSYGGDSGTFSAFVEALQNVGVEVEYQAVFPPFSSSSNSTEFINQVEKLLDKQSRVFIILKSSLSLAIQIFKEAKELRLIGDDSVWIIMEPLAGLLESLDSFVISTMEGALGLRYNFNENTSNFEEFKYGFRQYFRQEYPEEVNSEPGINALRAYDAINMMLAGDRAVIINSTLFLKRIQSSNFSGLSGEIRFSENNKLTQSSFSVVNVIGKGYKEIAIWNPETGFSRSLNQKTKNGEAMEVFGDLVYWPGDLRRIPKGWSMPSDSKRLRVGIPAKTTFKKFVRINEDGVPVGFSVDVFHEILLLLRYDLPYDFVPRNGTYNELIDLVANKTLDCLIGDVTILASRSKKVDFTQPYIESILSVIVKEKLEPSKAWIFVKPFTYEMWAVTGAIFIYTIFIIWLLERQSNPEFQGPWYEQLGTALWFASTTFFFAHREKIENSFTRVVVWVWLFLVLALTSGYTASLSSMLTVRRLEPNVTDISWLLKSEATVGCGNWSFISQYLEKELDFAPKHIRGVENEDDYPEQFEQGNIVAAFLESPYQKSFLNNMCDGYTAANPPDSVEQRFGGFGFAFQKGSPLVNDFSQAILNLSETGTLKRLERKWLSPSPKCSKSNTANNTDRLSLQSFWGLYVFSAATSTICYLLFLIHRSYDYCRSRRRRHKREHIDDESSLNDHIALWNSLIKLAKCFHTPSKKIATTVLSTRSSNPANRVEDLEISGSPYKWESASSPETPNSHDRGFDFPETPNQSHAPLFIEIPNRSSPEHK